MQIQLDKWNQAEVNEEEKMKVIISKANKKIGDKKIRFGQFLTSEEIAKFMVGLSSKIENDLVLEPSAGKGAFIKALKEKGYKKITGIEYDEEFFQTLRNEFPDVTLIHKDFLKTNSNVKYNLIIGNPPYVQWNNIEPEIRENLIQNQFWRKYANGEWDIFYAFIIWSIEQLQENGELIFIVPYNWFNSTHAKSLREYILSNGYFDTVLHFGELKLFTDCFPNNMIFKYVKTTKKDKPLMKVCDYSERKAQLGSLLADINNYLNGSDQEFITPLKCFEMSQFQKPDMWFLGNGEDLIIANKIENQTKINGEETYVMLSDYFEVSVGMVTGFDKAFFVKSGELNEYDENERTFIWKFAKAKNCLRYRMTEPEYYIFADDINSEEELRKFKNIFFKIAACREDIDKRYVSKNRKWWHWATVRNFDTYKKHLNEEKIFIPCIDRALKTRFSYTKDSCYGSGDVLAILKKKPIKEDIKYILAWLNSNFINKWYRIKGSKKGQRIQYTQAYVSKIPLRLINWNNKIEVQIHNNIVEIVDEIIKNGNKEEHENKLDSLFQQLIY